MERDQSNHLRVNNPFHDPLVTELIDEPELYSKMFSERVLVGETTRLYTPNNVVVVGPQGSGKSMLLNLIRYPVLGDWLTRHGAVPAPLEHVAPFFGISINLVRANFHAFGRRSLAAQSAAMDDNPDLSAAADFINHYLFLEFLKGVRFLGSQDGAALCKWMGLKNDLFDSEFSDIAAWDCWKGYYKKCESAETLIDCVKARLEIWRSFLNGSIDTIPEEVMSSKTTLGEPLHTIGNYLGRSSSNSQPLCLFAVVDQYEVLPELNRSFGSSLQRVVNDLIKARDPVVFYKIGARTYDWGKELRVWGAESRIELMRDYVKIDLSEILMRDENPKGWLFPDLCRDIATKRIEALSGSEPCDSEATDIETILGDWNAETESESYFNRDKCTQNAQRLVRCESEELREAIARVMVPESSALDWRLAGAWAIQNEHRGADALELVPSLPWNDWSWRKERIGIALIQLARLANSQRIYFGWEPVLYMAGGNVSAFLLLCSEIWDFATKMGYDPRINAPLPRTVQTEGIAAASTKWLERDRNETIGGSKRYEFVILFGAAVNAYLKDDFAISNPGHSGISLSEHDLADTNAGKAVIPFLQEGVNWAILEERTHKSKNKDFIPRRKYYLHPLLSAAVGIPYVRAKEPYYLNAVVLNAWLNHEAPIQLQKRKKVDERQKTLFGEEQ